MSTITNSNTVNPQVMGDMINAKIEAQLRLAPYAKLDDSLVGVPGDTKTVPSWNYIGDAADVAEGNEVTLSSMTASSTTFSIKKAMKAVAITQEAVNSGLGNPIGQAEAQLAKAIAGKVDSDVLNAALGASMVYDGTSSVINYDGIVEANGKFEDEDENYEKVMFIHPKQETQLLKDDDFISADKFEQGVAVRGSIGKIAGCWIKKSKKIPAVNAQSAVAGVYTVELKGPPASGDKITVNGTEVTLDSSSANTLVAAATAVATALGSDTVYTVTRNSAKLTLTEKSGKEGTGKPVCGIVSDGCTLEEVTTTSGKTSRPALYKCPIIKYDAVENVNDDELPAVTVFLKKDTQTDHDWKARTQTHEITTAKYYGVALTNGGKVVIAEFKQNA